MVLFSWLFESFGFTKKEHHGLGAVFSQNGASGPLFKEKLELGAKEKHLRCLQRHERLCWKSGVVVALYPGFGWDVGQVYPTDLFHLLWLSCLK